MAHRILCWSLHKNNWVTIIEDTISLSPTTYSISLSPTTYSGGIRRRFKRS